MSQLPQEMTIIFGPILKGGENGSSFTHAKYFDGVLCTRGHGPTKNNPFTEIG